MVECVFKLEGKQCGFSLKYSHEQVAFIIYYQSDVTKPEVTSVQQQQSINFI
jgi:hypothetical protein